MYLDESIAIKNYKQKMSECIRLIYPDIGSKDLNEILDYSIQKRYKNVNATLKNSYTHKGTDANLLKLTDYILTKEPITTAYGTLFKHHTDVPNPLAEVVNSFLELRGVHKKEMFKYPKGSEQFEKYNLLQVLDKIDANGIYGTIGMYTSLIYNINVATSITSQGRALTSSATMFFESFLADNVKFGSLNEVVEFVNNIKNERYEWKFNDQDWLDNFYTILPEDVFGKLVLDCGYRWVPDTDELEIIWNMVNNLDRRTLVRVWYKNNLYEFMENTKVFDIVDRMLHKLEKPLLNAVDIPRNISKDLNLFAELLKEFVYYHYMVTDRIDRTNNMIKSVICITDTDSCILSLDAWYRYVSNRIAGESFTIMNSLGSPIKFFEYTEEDEVNGVPKPWLLPVETTEKVYDYNFQTDEIIEMEREINPVNTTGRDNMTYSIVNMMAYVIDRLINDYMEKFCFNTHSYGPKYERSCRILMKNEFFQVL